MGSLNIFLEFSLKVFLQYVHVELFLILLAWLLNSWKVCGVHVRCKSAMAKTRLSVLSRRTSTNGRLMLLFESLENVETHVSNIGQLLLRSSKTANVSVMEARGLLEFEKLHKTLPKTAKSGAVHAQLNDVFGKIFYFNNLFSQKCKFICFFICQSTVFFFLQIFSARNFSRFFFLTSSIKLRELLDAQLRSCCLVQWLIHTGSLFLGSKA